MYNSLVPPDSFQPARIVKLERRVKDLGLDLGPEIYRYVNHEGILLLIRGPNVAQNQGVEG